MSVSTSLSALCIREKGAADATDSHQAHLAQHGDALGRTAQEARRCAVALPRSMSASCVAPASPIELPLRFSVCVVALPRSASASRS